MGLARVIRDIDPAYRMLALGALCILLWALISGRQGPLVELYDYGEHVASVREMAASNFHPGNPLLADEKPTLRYTPYVFALAALSRYGPLHLYSVLKLVSLINMAIFLLGLYLWAREMFGSETLPRYLLLAMLFMWGKPFGYSNEYCLRFFCYTAFYPSMFSFSLSFSGLYLLLRFLRCGRLKPLFGFLLLSLCIFLTHPLTASFYLVCCLLTALTRSDRPLQDGALVVLCGCLLVAVGLLWPYYDFMEAVTVSTTTPWYDFRDYLYDWRNLVKAGPALLGVPVLCRFALRRQHAFVVSGFVVCAVLYLGGALFDLYLLDRYIFFTIFFLHAGLAVLFDRLGVGDAVRLLQLRHRDRKRFAAGVLATLLVAGGMCYQAAKLLPELIGYQVNFTQQPMVQRYPNLLKDYRLLRRVLHRGDVVLSDPLTSWLVPACTGARIVVLYHNNPSVRDNHARVAAVEEFYRPSTAPEQRRDVVRRYGVTHVLLNSYRGKDTYVNRVRDSYLKYRLSMGLLEDFARLGELVYIHNTFMLIKVDTSLL